MNDVTVIKLTVKQEAFCLAYFTHGNASRAYRECYDVTGMNDNVVHGESSKLLAHPMVSARVGQLRQNARDQFLKTRADLIELCRQIILADPNELIATRVGCCRHCHGEGHRYQWREREYMAELAAAEVPSKVPKPLPDIAGGFGFDHTVPPSDTCPECRGEGVPRVVAKDTEKLSPGGRFLLRGVRQTKEGYRVDFADKDKYFEYACRLMGAFDDKLRLEGIAHEKVTELLMATTDPRTATIEYEKFVALG